MSDPSDIEVKKDIDIEVDFKLDAEFDIDVKKDVHIDVKVESDVDIKGNFSQVTFDVQAHGKDTFTEADVFVLTVEDELSSASGVITSVVG
ncbi:hypothetical protein KXR53_19735 [Inquilinus limosus]|uniref:hypothetical protein n=1 Tax=Inquilinus limosus TaxID=171674 RepID=UPI003F1666F4